MKNLLLALLLIPFLMANESCEDNSSDSIQQKQQEQLLQEGTSQVGMPSIKNFREKKLLKDILELRDQTGLVTYTYLFSEQTGKKIFLCNSVGYGIPYATQFTSPQKATYRSAGGYLILPQADPLGSFHHPLPKAHGLCVKTPMGML